jgi:hypothetical protein
MKIFAKSSNISFSFLFESYNRLSYPIPQTRTNQNMSTTTASIVVVRQHYRTLRRLIRHLPPHRYNLEESQKELQSTFRQPLAVGESLEQRLVKAEERVSFLRMITPKSAHRNINSSRTTTTTPNSSYGSSSSSGGKWVYKDGKRYENVQGTLRDSTGRVVSNWDGKNLDPDSVKRHNHQLKRLGFRNNAHAKGIF